MIGLLGWPGQIAARRSDVAGLVSKVDHEHLNRYRDKLAARLNINVLTDAARLLVGPWPASFVAYYPDLTLEIVIDDQFVDIVSGDFDGGIRFGGMSRRRRWRSP